jgi:hypothetical protein
MYQEKERSQIIMQLNIRQNIFHKFSKKNIQNMFQWTDIKKELNTIQLKDRSFT